MGTLKVDSEKFTSEEIKNLQMNYELLNESYLSQDWDSVLILVEDAINKVFSPGEYRKLAQFRAARWLYDMLVPAYLEAIKNNDKEQCKGVLKGLHVGAKDGVKD